MIYYVKVYQIKQAQA